MIVIQSYNLLAQVPTAAPFYHCQITVDNYEYKGIIPQVDAETEDVWDEVKAQIYFDARYPELLAKARELHVYVLDKSLEIDGEVQAKNLTVVLLETPASLVEARDTIKEELTKDRKSIAVVDLCLAKLVEDLIQRVEMLEKM